MARCTHLILALAATSLALGGVGCSSRHAVAVRSGVPSTPVWPRSSPRHQGLDPALLAEANREARTKFRGVTALLVARHGKLVFERYYRGVGANDRVAVFSITKTVVSALVGIALADG